MASISKTWWGNQFIGALERFTDSGRLARGRSYRSSDRIRQFEIKKGEILAQVRGNVNPYFGVYEEPLYKTKISMQPISAAEWSTAIAYIASKASFISKLMLNEMPENIETAFTTLGLNLLPSKRADFKTNCSCPDPSNPCKHIAGVCYRFAAELDRDPFLLFELRGLSREKLQTELAKSPLGQALAGELATEAATAEPVTSYYTRPTHIEIPSDLSAKAFWHGRKPLPKTIEVLPESRISGVIVKKQGDFPAFWQRENSFIAAMDELYDRVRTKNRDLGL